VRLFVVAFCIAASVAGCGTSVDAADELVGCPTPDWTGPWQECSDAEWVKRVVEAGGYDVQGGTGSALIALGRGHSFYVWATRNEAAGHEPEEAGVRTSWTTQGMTYWIEAGPSAAATKPSVDELAGVITASQRLAPPSP
jgi:hypothetical protein